MIRAAAAQFSCSVVFYLQQIQTPKNHEDTKIPRYNFSYTSTWSHVSIVLANVEPWFSWSVKDGLLIDPRKNATIIMPAKITMPRNAKRMTIFSATIISVNRPTHQSRAKISLQLPEEWSFAKLNRWADEAARCRQEGSRIRKQYEEVSNCSQPPKMIPICVTW